MSGLSKETFWTHVKRRNTNIYPIGLVPNFNCDADSINLFGTTSYSLITDPNGVRMRQTTPAFSGSRVGLFGDKIYSRQLNVSMYFKFKLLQTSCRFFIGLSDNTSMTTGLSPTGNFAGILFNEASGSLLFVTGSGGSLNQTPLGAIDFNVHDLYMWLFKSGGGDRIAFQLDNGTRLGTTVNMPTNSVFMNYLIELRTNSAIARSLETGKVFISQEA